MPLPSPVPRTLVHRRTIVCRGFERADGGIDVDATLTDVKTAASDMTEHGPLAPGEPMHDMALRLTVNDALTITDLTAVMDASPYRICPSITPNFRKLVGQSLAKGFGHAVRALLGGVEGCVHLNELLRPAATTVFQTLSRKWRLGQTGKNQVDTSRRPRLLDTCHAWASDGPVVKREFPQFYSGE